MADRPTGPDQRPTELSGRQRSLWMALGRHDVRLSNMYLGALVVLAQAGNPDRWAQAANSLRELQEKAPRYLNVPVEAKPESLAQVVKALKQVWERLARSKTYEKGWCGRINTGLREFLERLEEFFARFGETHPFSKDEFKALQRGRFPWAVEYPLSPEEKQAEAWQGLRDYFNGVCHHRIETDPGEFMSRFEGLENLLLACFCPETVQELDELDRVIAEGEAGGPAGSC